MGKMIRNRRKVLERVAARKAAIGKGPEGAGTPSENPEATLPQTPQQAQVVAPQGEPAGAPEQTPSGEDARKRRKQQMSNILGIQV